MAMPRGLGLTRIIALVNALAKLHNFCIGKNDSDPQSALLQQLNIDTQHIISHEDGYVPMQVSREHGMIALPRALMEPGHHFSGFHRNLRRQHERANEDIILPRQRLLKQVMESHLKRPTIK
jgi:hypothetical protein